MTKATDADGARFKIAEPMRLVSVGGGAEALFSQEGTSSLLRLRAGETGQLLVDIVRVEDVQGAA